MKKWQAWLDRGTLDNPDSELLCVADNLSCLCELILRMSPQQFKELQSGKAYVEISYGELTPDDLGG
jgi:hypothetical protein